MSTAEPVVAIVGATAAGKSDLALDVAEALGGEVVNTDSMQIYRGMDIGTAKLPLDQRRGIRHHLLDVLDVTETASVAWFQRAARAVVQDCRDRGVGPVLVGGSALYTRAVLDEMDFPGTDPDLRAKYEARLAVVGPEALHARLAEIDPQAARNIEPLNGRRIVRALEVIELTGEPFRATIAEPDYHHAATLQIGLDIDRPTLDDRIERRVRAMWQAGLVGEVRRLERAGLRQARTASHALGYQQVLAFLAGECTEAEAFARTVSSTRRFVRRQDAWFRKDRRVTWLAHGEPDRLERAVRAIRSVQAASDQQTAASQTVQQ